MPPTPLADQATQLSLAPDNLVTTTLRCTQKPWTSSPTTASLTCRAWRPPQRRRLVVQALMRRIWSRLLAAFLPLEVGGGRLLQLSRNWGRGRVGAGSGPGRGRGPRGEDGWE